MLYLRGGGPRLFRLSTKEGATNKRGFISCRHKEPKELSWQWSVKKNPDIMACKDLCISKICPKPSIFPRFKKHYIPVEKKPCVPKKHPMTWKEYLSFLLPDPTSKPPLIKCRKLQAERRKCCGNPMDCKAKCLRVNCCPPPKEWYGQAEIFAIPSNLPEAAPPQQEICAPPPPLEPTCVSAMKGICPIPRKSLNMDDYSYKKTFSGVTPCDEFNEMSSNYLIKGVCIPPPPIKNKDLRLTCGYFSEFKEVECPKTTSIPVSATDVPPLICKGDQEVEKKKEEEIFVEIKKGVCGRTTFLRPYAYGDKIKKEGKEKIHTLTNNIFPSTIIQKKSIHTTSLPLMKPMSETQLDGSDVKDGVKVVDVGMQPQFKEFNCQPSKSGVGLHYMLLRPLSSGKFSSSLFAPPEPYAPSEDNSFHHSQGIDPELIKLAEETKKKMSYGIPNKKNTETHSANTLAKQLSKAAEEKERQKLKEKREERGVSPTSASPFQKSKLSLLNKIKKPSLGARATFMTEAVKSSKKKDGKGKKDKNIICSGCIGVKAAEAELRNPTPKSFLDCKIRPSGKCRGPQRKVFSDEGEPQNPYFKNRQKPYSLCNKPRPVIKKKEKPYKMPCEDNNTKREFHSSTGSIGNKIEKKGSLNNKFHSTVGLNDIETDIPTLYDILKDKGINKPGKTVNQSNDWDSHTSDSYSERTYGEYESLPDLSKYHPNDDTTIKKMSYPVNLWENAESKKKSTWSNVDENKNSSAGVNRAENLNKNFSFKKQYPNQHKGPKDSSNTVPSKYHVLFNPTSIKKQQVDSNEKGFFINKTQDFKYNKKNTPNSKNMENYDLNKTDKESNSPNSKELQSCPLTTQNMWGHQQFNSSNQTSSSLELPNEMKSWDKNNPHVLYKENAVSDRTTHDIFRQKAESNKAASKSENEQSLFYKEKMSLLSDDDELNNISNINGSKNE